MTSLFELERWGNAYAIGYQYKFLWGKVVLEYEYTTCAIRRPWLPCYVQQFGGDHLYYWSFGWFRRSLSLQLWEFDQ